MRNTHSLEIEAARLHGAAFRSDPFAARRVLAHIRAGIENPHAVIAQARRLLSGKSVKGGR